MELSIVTFWPVVLVLRLGKQQAGLGGCESIQQSLTLHHKKVFYRQLAKNRWGTQITLHDNSYYTFIIMGQLNMTFPATVSFIIWPFGCFYFLSFSFLPFSFFLFKFCFLLWYMLFGGKNGDFKSLEYCPCPNGSSDTHLSSCGLVRSKVRGFSGKLL